MFPKLPKEIRLMIWEAALPGPRIVPIVQRELNKTIGQWEEENDTTWPPDDDKGERTADEKASCRDLAARAWGVDEEDYRKVPLVGMACGAPTIIPDVFMACKEAYAVATKQYKRTFGCAHSEPETYFNFKLDTLYIDYENFDSFRDPDSWSENPFQLDAWNGFRGEYAENAKNVQRLAVRVPTGSMMESFDEDIADILRTFRGLEEIFVIVRPNDAEDIIFEKEQLSDLNMIDPVEDVDEAIEICQDYIWKEEELYEQTYGGFDLVELPDIPWIQGPNINQLRLEELQQREGWALPQIEEKRMVSRAVKDAYEQVMEECESVIERIEARIDSDEDWYLQGNMDMGF